MFRKILLTLIIALSLTLSSVADGFKVLTLNDILTPRELVWMSEIFPTVNLDNVSVVVLHLDGPGKIRAIVQIVDAYPSNHVYLDAEDWAHVVWTKGVLLRDRDLACVILHEMIHIAQTHKGKHERLKMIDACKKPYAERYFELEAYRDSKMLEQYFPR